MPGRMNVQDIFKFTDGRVVFVGDIEGASPFIRPGKWRLLVDGETQDMIEIEGEMIASRKQTTARSLSTTQKLDIDEIRARLGAIMLIEE